MITEGTTVVRARGVASRAPAKSSANRTDAELPRKRAKARAAERDAQEGPGAGAGGDASLRWRQLIWVGVGVAWLFITLSLLGFSAADPPAPGVYPHNAPVANWCGRAGALVAFYSYELLGHGVWMLCALGALWLGITATGRRVSHLSVRVLGALLMGAGVSSLQALWFSASGPVPGLPGGLVGTVATARLVESFSSLGSFLCIALAFGIGATVCLDVWAFLAALWTGRALVAAGRTSGRLAYAAARAAHHRRQKSLLAKARPDDVSDDITLNAAAAGGGIATAAAPVPPKRSNRLVAGKVPNEAGGIGATEPFDPDGSSLPAAAPLAVGDVDGAESDDEGVSAEDGASGDAGAPKTFDPATLRAKIAKLPVRFANLERRSATDEDLQDIQRGGGATNADLEGYRFPGLDQLEEPEGDYSETMETFVREQAEALERAVREYGIEGEVVGVESGPVITLFELRLAPGTKVSQLSAVASDLARALKAVNIRIVPNMAGRDTVGVEVPNAHKEKVRLKELMTRNELYSTMRLPMFLGKDASGEPLIGDLSQMPHMLIAGTTGSGKSVCMNTIIMSFLYTKKPNELKLVLVDPKMVELSQFKDIPHLMCPVVTEMGKAAAILEWAVGKMDERYELLAEAGCRDIAAYNELPWEELKERFACQTPEEEARIPRKLPYMVFVIDELADLMMTNKEVEHSIVRIAQKARAVGIHLILATQRPQANVVTGLIKSNMPARIAFKVASGMDSRIVLDQKGGELLLGQGDMLYLSPRSSKLTRAQGTLVDDKEIRRVVKFMREIAAPTFERQLLQLRAGGSELSEDEARDGFMNAQEDPLFDQAVEIVLETKRGSVSMLQRRLAIGYTRAARLIEMMGEAGILGTHKGTVAREVVMTLDEWHAMKDQAAADAAAGTGGAGGEGGPLNSGPNGETLEVIQARVNGRGGDGGEVPTSAAADDDFATDVSLDDADGAEEESDPPLTVQTRPATSFGAPDRV